MPAWHLAGAIRDWRWASIRQAWQLGKRVQISRDTSAGSAFPHAGRSFSLAIERRIAWMLGKVPFLAAEQGRTRPPI